MAKPLTGKKLDAAVSALFYKHGDGVQFDMMDLGKLSRAAKQAYVDHAGAGHDEALLAAEDAMVKAIGKFRKNPMSLRACHRGLHETDREFATRAARLAEGAGASMVDYGKGPVKLGSLPPSGTTKASYVMANPGKTPHNMPYADLLRARARYPYLIKFTTNEWAAIRTGIGRKYSWSSGLLDADMIEETPNGRSFDITVRYSESSAHNFHEAIDEAGEHGYPLAGPGIAAKLDAFFNKVI